VAEEDDADQSSGSPGGINAKPVGDLIEVEWSPGLGPATRYRLLRSERGFAHTAGALPGTGQTVVAEGAINQVRDGPLNPAVSYFYTLFRRGSDGVWRCVPRPTYALPEASAGPRAPWQARARV